MFSVVISFAALWAEDSISTDGSEELRSDNHKSVVRQMKEILETIKLVRHRKNPIVAELVPEPVLNWDDLPRGHHHGTLWLWGAKGRPAAIIEMYTVNFSEKINGWPGNVAHSLAAEPLTSEGPRHWDWAPQESGFTPQKLVDAPIPAKTQAARRLQMRSLAKRFSANESWRGERAELRLLTTPVWLYESPDEGISDGGLFAFVHGGTNPETILVLEARTNETEPFWQFGCVRLGHAQMQVNFDDAEAWSAAEYGKANPKSTYYFLNP